MESIVWSECSAVSSAESATDAPAFSESDCAAYPVAFGSTVSAAVAVAFRRSESSSEPDAFSSAEPGPDAAAHACSFSWTILSAQSDSYIVAFACSDPVANFSAL